MNDSIDIDTLLFDAKQRPPRERSLFLDHACGRDSDLRASIEVLLAADLFPDDNTSTKSFGQTPIDGPPTVTFRQESPFRVNLADKYQLIRPIGEGGMGTVFLALQTAPVRRAVAVKLIKAGRDSKAVLARFDAERQALAMMDHPNIAKVLDAGTTEANGGQPSPVLRAEPRETRARQYLRNTYLGRARSYDQLERYPEAIQDWGQGIELSTSSDLTDTRFMRVISRRKAGLLAEATAEVIGLTKPTVGDSTKS